MSKISKSRQLLFSVSIKDCEVQHFRAGGRGGQNQNKVNSGTRIIHHASGARGEARDSRDQHQNKKAAFLRMTKTKEFQSWLRVATAKALGEPSAEEVVEKQMQPGNLRVEARDDNGHWRTFVEE